MISDYMVGAPSFFQIQVYMSSVQSLVENPMICSEYH